MELVVKNIDELVFDPSNARKHPMKNIEAIKGSLVKFGQQKPIVINKKNIVIAGNGTLAAFKDLGWKQIKCVVSDLDDLNQMAFALADNRTAELAEWDVDILNQQLAQLDLNDFDLDEIGFDDINLEGFETKDDDESKNEKKIVYKIIVEFKNEDEQTELFSELNERGFCVKVSL